MCKAKTVLALSFLVNIAFSQGEHWTQKKQPKLAINYLTGENPDFASFSGNLTHNDHFKLLQVSGDFLLIGARNVVYNLSLDTLEENEADRIHWPTPERDRELCLVKGKTNDECQNYIRVVASPSPGSLLVCGTNSFKPKCRFYNTKAENKTDDGEGRGIREFSGQGFCPYDPKHNSTAIFSDGSLYAATVADFSGSDALIIKDRIRTEQYNLKHLNAPNFVGSAEDDSHVYFFFREFAVEHMNCGKAVFSRVARVCKNDKGGPHKFKNKWTSFMKARLNCSVSGDIPFYFNEIQSTSGWTPNKMIYGVFTTPENALTGSAVCAFTLQEIQNAFNGPFKSQETTNSNWLPVKADEHLGSCSRNSKELDEQSLNFVHRHPLKDLPVDNVASDPLLVRPGERLTVVAVDPNVRVEGARDFDVVFVGTNTGKVIKFVSVDEEGKRRAVVIEEIQVFPHHVPITNLAVAEGVNASSSVLVALSAHSAKRLPVHRCGLPRLQNCRLCVALQDPYCGWDTRANECVAVGEGDAAALVQDVETGRHSACNQEGEDVVGLGLSDTDLFITKEEKDIIAVMDDEASKTKLQNYSGSHLALAVCLAVGISVLVGFATGFLVSRKFGPKSYKSCGHHYLETQSSRNKENPKCDNSGGYSSAPVNNVLLQQQLSTMSGASGSSTTGSGSTTATQCSSNTLSSEATSITPSKNSNLLANLPAKDDPQKSNINANTLGRTGTLCKKVYL